MSRRRIDNDLTGRGLYHKVVMLGKSYGNGTYPLYMEYGINTADSIS